MLVDLETIKKHVNVDSSFTDDDEYLTSLEAVAEDLVQKHIDRSFEDIMENEGSVPSALLQSILLFIGNFYANRESISYAGAVEIPRSIGYILDMYRDYSNANI